MPSTSWADFPVPRLLVIDDNPTVHDAFSGIIQRESPDKTLEADEALMFGEATVHPAAKPIYQVDHSFSGQDGIDKVRQAIDEDRPYQVAFVDIRMPVMDGVETIEQIWKIDSRIQTVICTAYADYRWDDLASRLGETDRLLVLKKPFHDIEIMQLASTLSRKWFLGQQAALKLKQMESLVAQRTQKVLEHHRQEHQRIHDLDQTKLKCLFRLAQEFRGPLTLILNPLEDLLKGAPLDRAQQELIYRNARDLSLLVENSLLLRRLEPEDQKLDSGELELVSFVRGLVQSFAAGAWERGFQLHFEADVERHTFWTDAAKLEKVLFNLLARARDAAPDHARITLHLRLDEDSVRLVMEAPQIPNPDGISRAHPSEPTEADIALLLTQETLRLMHGSLKIDTLPARTPHDGGLLQMSITLAESKPEPRPASSAPLAAAASIGESASEEKESPLIQIVEENADFRTFVRMGLGTEYRFIETARSGEVMVQARENVPDLIVVDFDRTQSDAIALCKELKREPITSHIPVILLGADVTEASQIDALEAGVDDYLTKPFRLPLLKARVSNLLETRRKLHRHFQELATVQPRDLASNPIDAEFLRRVVEIVEKNMADCEFDVESLAQQVAVSRRQLFRKFKAIAGCTPNVFIRNIRLKHAARLLLESQMTVAEIIYAVGFSDPKHFRTVFRERFGALPGEYTGQAKLQ